MPIDAKVHSFEIRPRPSIADEVYEFLRRQILTGSILNGERLIVSELAEKLNVSRTPVRESLHKLEMEKLISSLKPKAGYLVKDVTEEDVAEICDIRMVTEALAAKRASNKITSKELDRLDEIILLTDKCIRKKDSNKVVELDTEFHDIICKASRSARIEEINQRLRDQMLRLRVRALCVPEIALKSNEGHRKIAQAIRSKDSVKIDSAFMFHLGQTQKSLADISKNEQ
jgi:DNA-binding GntR family transcriptional regulator